MTNAVGGRTAHHASGDSSYVMSNGDNIFSYGLIECPLDFRYYAALSASTIDSSSFFYTPWQAHLPVQSSQPPIETTPSFLNYLHNNRKHAAQPSSSLPLERPQLPSLPFPTLRCAQHKRHRLLHTTPCNAMRPRHPPQRRQLRRRSRSRGSRSQHDRAGQHGHRRRHVLPLLQRQDEEGARAEWQWAVRG